MSRSAEGPLADPGRRAYVSYLLRIWRLERNGAEVWRLTLVDPATGEAHRFSHLEDMVRYLVDPLASPPTVTHDPDS